MHNLGKTGIDGNFIMLFFFKFEKVIKFLSPPRPRLIAQSMNIAYQKVFNKRRYAALKGIRSMWDLLDYPLRQNLTSISIT